LAILGPNGSGKSTLLKLLMREIYPFAGKGSVSWFGRSDWTQRELRKQIGFVQPIPAESLLDDFDTFSMVVTGAIGTMGVTEYDEITPEMKRRAEWLMEQWHLADRAGQSYASLSAGERQRALLARAMMPPIQVLLLDEPTAGLDFAAREQFLNRLVAMKDAVAAIVLVTHHFEELVPQFDRMLLLQDGRVVANGGTDDVLRPEIVAAAFGSGVEAAHREIALRQKLVNQN
jgi:iron complex transport system ATP-binding protein